ncbi:MAG: hypothetical protein K6A37_01555 [Saccharofermentans sp.]|nr:hypothetical protein [Saccharofermentans sp.]
MDKNDISIFTNVEVTGADTTSLSEEESSVLFTLAKYCQAMTDADIADGRLVYFTIGN